MPPQHLPELLGVARPARPHQQLHRLRRADQPAVRHQPRQEVRHQRLHVLDVVAQRRQLHRAREEPQQIRQLAAVVALAQRDRHPGLALARPAPPAGSWTGRRRRPVVSRSTCRITTRALVGQQLAPRLGQPAAVTGGRRRRARRSARPGCGAGARRGRRPACRRPAPPPARATRRRRRSTATWWQPRSHSAPEPTRPGRNIRSGVTASARSAGARLQQLHVDDAAGEPALAAHRAAVHPRPYAAAAARPRRRRWGCGRPASPRPGRAGCDCVGRFEHRAGRGRSSSPRRC